jgi:hypothetical protein
VDQEKLVRPAPGPVGAMADSFARLCAQAADDRRAFDRNTWSDGEAAGRFNAYRNAASRAENVAEALDREVERLRGVLAEEHERVLELQRERTLLQEQLDERKEAVDELRRELERHRPRPVLVVKDDLAAHPFLDGVELILPDAPAPRAVLEQVIGELVQAETRELEAGLRTDLTVFGRAGVEIPAGGGKPRLVPQDELQRIADLTAVEPRHD